jgi:hypothetical protein
MVEFSPLSPSPNFDRIIFRFPKSFRWIILKWHEAIESLGRWVKVKDKFFNKMGKRKNILRSTRENFYIEFIEKIFYGSRFALVLQNFTSQKQNGIKGIKTSKIEARLKRAGMLSIRRREYFLTLRVVSVKIQLFVTFPNRNFQVL